MSKPQISNVALIVEDQKCCNLFSNCVQDICLLRRSHVY
jgi:hypothetical protein